MSEHWDVYFGYMEDKPASVVLDMDVWQEIDTEAYNNGFALKIKLKTPNPDGFAVDEEAELLNEIEDDFINNNLAKDYLQVGRITSDGERDIIFYSQKNEKKDLIIAAERIYKPAGYDFEVFEIEEDETWEFYFDFLYPNPYQMQHMGNRDLVERLEEEGDPLVTPRKVEHWVYFEDKKDMKRFIKAVKKEGFAIEDESDEQDEDGKFVLSISRADSVDYDSINDVTDLLVETAEECEGEYDGWETFVIKG